MISKALRLFGCDLHKMVQTVHALPRFLCDAWTFSRQRQRFGANDFRFGKWYPCLGDREAESGVARGHYFHQDLLVARRIFEANPHHHVDVGSRIDGFVAHVAAFRPIEVLDVRKLSSEITNITFRQIDIMSATGENMVDYCDSLSCLHALEHFGLGRYGEPLEYNGHLMGLSNIYRLLRRGGTLYLSVPIGPQRIEFNAHRVFSLGYLLSILENQYRIVSLAYVDDGGALHERVELTVEGVATNLGCRFGCAILEMKKQ